MEIPEFVSGEKYNLKWNRHNNIIASNVLEHLSEEELVDVTLSCDGKFIKAHKLILSASSQYFKELFQRHKNQNPIIIMTNIKFEYLTYIIDYMYKGEIKLLSSEIQGILNLANELQIKGLSGILNKSFQHLADIKHEKKTSPKNKKCNKKSERCHDKPTNKEPTGIPSTSLNIIVEASVKNRLNCNDLNEEKKREAESNMKQDRNKKRKISEAKTTAIVHEINLSRVFRPSLPRPNNMEEKSSSVDSQAVTTPYDSATSPTQAEATSSSYRIPLPPLVPSSEESLEFLSKETKTNDISTYCMKLKEESSVSSHKSKLEIDANSTDTQNGLSQSDTKQLDKTESMANLSKDNPKPMDGSANKSTAIKQTSAFMLFTDEYRPILSLEYPDESVKQISLRLSSMWKNLPIDSKDLYYEEASKANEKLKRKITK